MLGGHSSRRHYPPGKANWQEYEARLNHRLHSSKRRLPESTESGALPAITELRPWLNRILALPGSAVQYYVRRIIDALVACPVSIFSSDAAAGQA